ncbi:MAG: PCRF domain-containing protein, partial [Oscillospiraceae bacterium]|nr:PCRF domain-containing protein [Oscillospiraceae bacterium]
MLQFEELRLRLLGQKQKLAELREALGLDAAREECTALEATCAAEGFWEDPRQSQAVLQRIAKLKAKEESCRRLEQNYEDALAMVELADEEEAEELLEECRAAADTFIAQLEAQTLSTLLTGEYDGNNAILTFHAGAGGTEAQDWNLMLVRMYTRWSERHGFKCALVDFLD